MARSAGARVDVIKTNEMQETNYTSNPINRCYFCKAELFKKLDALAQDRGFRVIAYGENADDAQQIRPGRSAAAEFQVLAPLKDVGLTKIEIRLLSRRMNLPTADAPAQPCLSSRIPHGTPVTIAALGMIEQAEALVRSFGFRVFRVRHQVEAERARARLEIAPEEMGNIPSLAPSLQTALRGDGYTEVLIEARGYRLSGRLAQSQARPNFTQLLLGRHTTVTIAP